MNSNKIDVQGIENHFYTNEELKESCESSDYILIYVHDADDAKYMDTEAPYYACLTIGIYFSNGIKLDDEDHIPYIHFNCYTDYPADLEGIKAPKKIRDKMYKLKAKFRKWNPNILIEVDTTIWNFVEE